MRKITTSSYSNDDGQLLSGFLDIIGRNTKIPSQSCDRFSFNCEIRRLNLIPVEQNVLHHITGYIISSIVKNQKTCRTCVSAIASRRRCNVSNMYNKLTAWRCYKQDTLYFMNRQAFEFFQQMELMFRAYKSTELFNSGLNLKDFLVQKFEEIEFELPICHMLKRKIITRFVLFKLKVNSIKPRKTKVYSSKTMAMHINTQ